MNSKIMFIIATYFSIKSNQVMIFDFDNHECHILKYIKIISNKKKNGSFIFLQEKQRRDSDDMQ